MEKPVVPRISPIPVGLLEGLPPELLPLLLLLMRNRIWEIRWFAEYNVAYWNRVQCLLLRIDIGVKIALGLGSIVSLSALAFDPDWIVPVVVVTGVCAILSTVVIPAARWPEMLGSIESVRHQWINIARQAKLVWEELEDGKTVSRRQAEVLEEMMRDLEKENFWIGDMEKQRLKAIDEARIILG